MAGKRDFYAREVLRAGRDLGITRQGIIIGFATVSVECDWIMHANRADPESLEYPHERIGKDSKSSGLFQQQPPWWGTVAQRMDPYQSAVLFFTELRKLPYDTGARSPGWYAQAVQRSSFPDRYDTRIGEATALYEHITSTETEGAMVPAYTMNEIDLTGSHSSHSSRNGARPWLFVLHTQEGNGTAESLHNYFKVAQVSYHYTVDNKTLIGSVNTDRAAWSVLDANPYTLNLCFAGSRAGQSRQEWLDRFGNAIDLAAQVAVRDSIQYGIEIRVLGQDYDKIARKVQGVCDHSGITYGLKIGNHTDVGPNFPWDVFEERVHHWASGEMPAVPEPLVNAVDVEADANPWLGERITAGEGEAVDGGKYAHFEHGSVYWHPSTGAWAIPAAIMEPYEALRWEQSYVGFPVGRHTELPDGVVQGFQGGAIYRKNGYGGHVVTGMIRAFWDRSGYENGRFGWPISDEIWADGTGTVRYQNFEGGRITWSADGTVGTHERPGFDAITTEEI
ncbi:LGFP repeat-containing protein [Rhodococcus sp. SMB37]|uniref:N-acetylmuramoyl-L-alanine amidase n=1 Tax=Rhodococcus sp. SMB37 TaxID=2512213 RepID=UPI0010CE94AA|nr:N-acetylmuramoyl-L-alanine amidase [Rhodococcus sp. SMB37]TCN51770.1 LGFP repeat-containing protein [Rhodococcus sp. SMB37]